MAQTRKNQPCYYNDSCLDLIEVHFRSIRGKQSPHVPDESQPPLPAGSTAADPHKTRDLRYRDSALVAQTCAVHRSADLKLTSPLDIALILQSKTLRIERRP